jgi:hypothetical protein
MSRSWRRDLLLIVMLSLVKTWVRVVFLIDEPSEHSLTAGRNYVPMGAAFLSVVVLIVVAFKITYWIYPRDEEEEDEEGKVQIQSLFDNKNSK